MSTTDISIPPQPEASPSRLIATLGIAGLLSGVILVSTYLFTLPMIEAHRADALRRAVYEVLPGAESMTPLALIDGALTDAAPEENAPTIYAGYDAAGQLIGFAIPAEEPGFQDVIKGIFGLRADGDLIVGFEVLESKETPGLGDKIFKDQDFVSNFSALAVAPAVVAVKKGEKSKANEVEAITGATISSKAVVRLLQNGLDDWLPAIEQYLETQQAAARDE